MIARRLVNYLDSRLGSASFVRAALDKVFPDHWSFMLGEICIYAFLLLLATGTYVAFFFNDSDTTIRYTGSYLPLAQRIVPASYASVLNLSFDVPLGLFVRQVHHWSALLFTGAIIFHMCRVFFTGAYRRPRELNWYIGLSLFLLALADGFSGYSLPGDGESGAGLRIAYSVAQSLPVVGNALAYGFFGGRFPTDQMTSRLYILHVWLVPLAIAGAMSLHLAVLWRQHHTQFPGPGRTESNVVGSKLWPFYAMKSIGLLVFTAAVACLLGGLFTINPIWIYGPYDPWTIASPSQPDWYLAWLDGSLRAFPGWAIHLFGHTVPPLFWSGAVVPGLLFGALFAWPALERALLKDDREHNLVQMPYDAPWRLGLGVGTITFATLLGLLSSDDVQAKLLHIAVEPLLTLYRVLLLVAPPVAGALAVAIGFELRARLRSRAGLRQVRRATLRRNEAGGFEEEPGSA